MSVAYTFKVTFDHKGDHEVYRDVIVKKGQNLEDFHFGIIAAFGLDKGEMASFYEATEDWDRGDEFPLEDMGNMGGEDLEPEPMKTIPIEQVANKGGDKLLYVYDFLNMHTFLVELMWINETEKGKKYPLSLGGEGEVEAAEKKFVADDDGEYNDPDLMESYITEADDEDGDDEFSNFNEFDDEYY